MAWLATDTAIAAAACGTILIRVLPVITWLLLGGLSFLLFGIWPVWIVLIWSWILSPVAYLVERLQANCRG